MCLCSSHIYVHDITMLMWCTNKEKYYRFNQNKVNFCLCEFVRHIITVTFYSDTACSHLIFNWCCYALVCAAFSPRYRRKCSTCISFDCAICSKYHVFQWEKHAETEIVTVAEERKSESKKMTLLYNATPYIYLFVCKENKTHSQMEVVWQFKISEARNIQLWVWFYQLTATRTFETIYMRIKNYLAWVGSISFSYFIDSSW